MARHWPCTTATSHLVVLAGFGDLEAEEPVELTDRQIATIAAAAVDKLP